MSWGISGGPLPPGSRGVEATGVRHATGKQGLRAGWVRLGSAPPSLAEATWPTRPPHPSLSLSPSLTAPPPLTAQHCVPHRPSFSLAVPSIPHCPFFPLRPSLSSSVPQCRSLYPSDPGAPSRAPGSSARGCPQASEENWVSEGSTASHGPSTGHGQTAVQAARPGHLWGRPARLPRARETLRWAPRKRGRGGVAPLSGWPPGLAAQGRRGERRRRHARRRCYKYRRRQLGDGG